MRGRRIAALGCLLALVGVATTATAYDGAGDGPVGSTATGAAAVSALPSSTDPLPSVLRARAWKRIPTHTKVVALTFDGGGGAGGVGRILRTLAREDVPATFFLTGRWARTFPGRTKRIAKAGYVLGNHTDTHSAVPGMSPSRLRSEIRATERAIRASAGRDPGPWFRFPYGAHTPRDVDRVNELGYACVQWTVDSAGWMGTSGGMSVTSVVDRVLRAVRPGAIVLMHVGEHPTDGSTLDADALPRLIAELRARGYSFTTVEALA